MYAGAFFKEDTLWYFLETIAKHIEGKKFEYPLDHKILLFTWNFLSIKQSQNNIQEDYAAYSLEGALIINEKGAPIINSLTHS